MCGIVGLFDTREQRAVDVAVLGRMNAVQFHRGPDEGGQHAEPGVGLGHRRLSIIDLSAQGNQPLKIDDFVIVFNGEIFNYIELRNELIQLGYAFKTNTDTEVIVKIYEHFGVQGFGKMNGMWAFILYDIRQKKVITCRDRFSIKPMYVLNQDNQIFWASEIKQLLPLLHKSEINKEVMFQFLQQNLLDQGSDTFYKNIHHAKPMCAIIIDLATKTSREEKYWNYDNATSISTSDYETHFAWLLHDSINLRLRSDVKIGTLLSGGLDSSAISILANEIQHNNIFSFSVISEDKKVSEERFIDIVVKSANLKNVKLNFQAEAVPQYLDKVLDHQGEPFGSLSVVAQHLIFKKIKDETDIVVLLSGQGGDEVMLGYLKFYYYNLIALGKSFNWIDFSRQLIGALAQQTVLKQFSIHEAKRYIPFLSKQTNDFMLLNERPVNTWNFGSLRERQIQDIDHYSVPALTHYEDRNSMAYSLEIRHPFLDHRIADFLVNIPTSLKIKNGWTKYILRKSIKQLPPEIAWRKDKLGFDMPDEKWLKNDLKNLVIEQFQNSTLDKLGIISAKSFMNYYNEFLNGNSSTHHQVVFKTLITEMWAKKNGFTP